jgi:hypothetical protein
MNNTSISQLFQRELLPRERILWTGQPIPYALLNKGDIFLIPFSFIWFGIVLSSFRDMFKASSSMIFPSFLIPALFLIVGFYMSIGRFIYLYLVKKKTYYAITDQRVLVLTNLFGKNLQAVYIKDLQNITKSENSNGNGTIIFGNQNNNSNQNSGLSFFNSYNGVNVPTFSNIKDVKQVYEKVNKLKNDLNE